MCGLPVDLEFKTTVLQNLGVGVKESQAIITVREFYCEFNILILRIKMVSKLLYVVLLVF